jgi:hypothetical protein
MKTRISALSGVICPGAGGMTRQVESDPSYVFLDGGLRGPGLAFAYLLDSVSG